MNGLLGNRTARASGWHRTVARLGPVLLTLVIAGCGGGDDGDELGEAGDGGDVPTLTDASGDVTASIEDLLASYIDVTNQITADTSVASAADDPLVQDFLALYEPDSRFAADILENWAAQPVRVEPYEDGWPANLVRVDGDVEVVADDEVIFPTCNERRSLQYDADDVLVEQTPYFETPGEGRAVLVDGAWRLTRLDVFPDTGGCRTDPDGEAAEGDGERDGVPDVGAGEG